MTQSAQPRKILADEIVGHLRDEIVRGTLLPGVALAEPVLAKRFSVSRAPVREALIKLERAGLVEFKTTGRTCVRTMEEKDVREILEARIALEAMGARLAAQKWTPADSQWIEDSIQAQELASTPEAFSQLDIAMHEYIMKRGGNGRLLGLWQDVRWQFEMALTYIHHLQQETEEDLRRFTATGHWNVLKPLSERQPEAAARIMTQHILGSLEWYVPESGERADEEGLVEEAKEATKVRQTGEAGGGQ